MLERTFSFAAVLIFLLSLCPAPTTYALPNPSEIIIAQLEGYSPTTLDPAVAYDTASGELISNVYETLISFDREKTDRFVPMLATNWTISSDGLTYTFKIRGTDGTEPPVRFHNERLLTTEDVEHSFERLMVQDYGGPAYMLYEPLLDRRSSRDEAGNITVTAEQIDNAITHTNTTVTFHLSKPYLPFLQILCQTWSSILNKEWCAALGDWPGTWSNWQNYNNPETSPIDLQNTEAPGPHVNAMSGTGPYYLEYLDTDLQEWSIHKFDEYWRGWPSPDARGYIERAKATWHYTWSERRDMFLSGNVDVVSVPVTNTSEVSGQLGIRCIYPLSALDCAAFAFNFNITESSPYMGVPGGLPRGRLDESGIPPDFFGDVDVRKGFAYSFNYTKMLSESYMPEGAQQPATPVVPGIPFHNFGQEKYSMNLTKAEEHFKAAWGGQLWIHGFNMTICYIGQLSQKMCEIIKATVESLNPKFHIKMISVLGEYGQRLRAGELTIFRAGWLTDFPDPHSFVLPFMYSQEGFALFQRYANATVDALIEAGVRELNQTRREQIYYDLQRIYHDECPSVPYGQSIQRRFEHDWVQCWYFNPASYGYNYFYTQWKELVPPAVVTSGSNVVDAVAVSDTLIVLNATALGNVSVSRHDVNIDGTTPEDTVNVKYVTVDSTLSRVQIVWPVEIRLYCTEEDIRSANVDESTLQIYDWNQTSQEWMLQSDSRWVTPSDQPEYAGYVRSKSYQLGVFAVLARPRGFTDLNEDGKVNILDITIVARAYGTKPGDPKWNPIADLDKNGIINIIDITMVARDYGKTV